MGPDVVVVLLQLVCVCVCVCSQAADVAHYAAHSCQVNFKKIHYIFFWLCDIRNCNCTFAAS